MANVFQGSLPSPFSHLLCGVTRWGSLPIFLPLESPVAGKSKKGMKGGCCGQGAGTGFRVPASKRPGKVLSEGWSCPNQSGWFLPAPELFGQRGIKGGQGYLFTFCPPFWLKEIRANLLCPAPPSFLSLFLVSLLRTLRTKNPKFEREGLLSPPHYPWCDPALSPRSSPLREQRHRFPQMMSDSSYYSPGRGGNLGTERESHSSVVTQDSDSLVEALKPHPSSKSVFPPRKMSIKGANSRKPASNVP